LNDGNVKGKGVYSTLSADIPSVYKKTEGWVSAAKVLFCPLLLFFSNSW